MQCNFK